MTELERYKENLKKLKQQAAMYGMAVPLPLLNEIEFHEEKIRKLQPAPCSIRRLPKTAVSSRVALIGVTVLLVASVIGLIGYTQYQVTGGILGFILGVLAFAFVCLYAIETSQAKQRLKTRFILEYLWLTWKERVDSEFQAKWFVSPNDLEDIAELYYLDKDTLHLVLAKYKLEHPDRVAYCYVYDLTEGTSLYYQEVDDHEPLPGKVLIDISRFPSNKYYYTT